MEEKKSRPRRQITSNSKKYTVDPTVTKDNWIESSEEPKEPDKKTAEPSDTQKRSAKRVLIKCAVTIFLILAIFTLLTITVYRIQEDNLIYAEVPGGYAVTGYEVTGICYITADLVIPSEYNGKPVVKIAERAFYDCVHINCITVPDSVTSIGNSAFSYCTSLSSVAIGEGVTSIGGYAFSGRSGLDTVYYKGTAEEWYSINIYDGNDKLTSATRYYYSENAPTESGNFWHYVDGVPTPW